MAYSGKKITNPITGQTIHFLQTASDTEGQLLEMESSFAPYSKEPAPHFHPYQDEVFEVIRGELSIRINGQIHLLTEGQKITICRNTVHSMWNHSSLPSTVNWKVTPALETEEFFENAMGLASDGRSGKNGMPSLLQASLMVPRYADEFRLASPAPWVQHVLFSMLKPLAKLKGLRARYTAYID